MTTQRSTARNTIQEAQRRAASLLQLVLDVMEAELDLTSFLKLTKRNGPSKGKKLFPAW